MGDFVTPAGEAHPAAPGKPIAPPAWPGASVAPQNPPNISDDGFAEALARLSACERDVRVAMAETSEAQRAEASRIRDLISAQEEFDRIVSYRRKASPAGTWRAPMPGDAVL